MSIHKNVAPTINTYKISAYKLITHPSRLQILIYKVFDFISYVMILCVIQLSYTSLV